MPRENSPVKKIIVIVVCVLFVLAGVYFFLFRSAAPQVSVDSLGNPVQAQVVGQDLLDLLNQLASVQLDDSVFHEQAFTNLTDEAITLPTEPEGRANPFDHL